MTPLFILILYNEIIMNILEWTVLIGAAIGAIGVMFAFVKKVVLLFKTWFQFTDAWFGTEETLGVVKRLEEGNQRFDNIESELMIIKAELFNNHGTSLRDSIDRIEAAVTKKDD